MSGGEGFLDEGEETAGGVAGDDIEWDQVIAGADEVFVVGIEDAEIVLAPEVQQETQTVCALKVTGFLAGKRGRPRWASTCFLNSSEEIERREDKISRIRSSLMSGRTGDFWGWLGFTGHEARADSGWRQVGF